MDEQMTITLRNPTVTDAPAIANLQCVTWRKAYTGVMPDAFLAGLDEAAFTVNWTRALASSGPGEYQVACIASSIIGFATFGPARDSSIGSLQLKGYAELAALNVHPEYWRCGVGARLLSEVEAALLGRYSTMYLWVADGNARAQAFYQKQGFRLFGDPRQSQRVEGVREQAMIKDFNEV